MAWTVAGRSRRPCGSGAHAGATFLLLSEEVEDDNDKTLDFDTDVAGNQPGSTAAELLWLYVEYTADGTTAGNRILEMSILDASGSSDVVGGWGANDVLTQGESEHFMFASHLEPPGSPVVGNNQEPVSQRLPQGVLLFSGMGLQVQDSASGGSGIDPNDNIIIHAMLAVYP